jgi:DHA1 family inner membrane transport protein
VSAVPVALAVFGIGMTVGNVLGGRLADWSVPRALVLGFTLTLVILATFPVAARSRVGVAVAVLALGIVGSITVNALQLRLMDTAGPAAASLGASLNHSALNLANASGAFLGGLVIDAGFGWTSPAWVGAGLAAVGLVMAVTSVLYDRRQRQRRPSASLVPAEAR